MKIFMNLKRLNIDYMMYKFTMCYLLLYLIYICLFFVLCFLFLLLEIYDVFIVGSTLEEVCISNSPDFIGVTDMSDIVDTTDIIDYIDYYSLVNNIDMVKEKCWLYQCFDDFVRLFRKDSGINIEFVRYVNEENFDKVKINVEHKSIGIYREFLENEVLRLSKIVDYNARKNSELLENIVNDWADTCKGLQQDNSYLDDKVKSLVNEIDKLNVCYSNEVVSRFCANITVCELLEEVNTLKRGPISRISEDVSMMYV
jgi:hypothetical protein